MLTVHEINFPGTDVSKVVDSNGEPLVVWHGSEEEFSVFDRPRGRKSMDIQGLFFSPDKMEAEGYRRNVRGFS